MDDNSVLTPRERQIAELIALGMSNKEIARQLGLRPQTVKNSLVHVFRKTSTRTRTQLAVRLALPKYTSTGACIHDPSVSHAFVHDVQKKPRVDGGKRGG